MSEQFDWFDDESIAFPTVNGVAVYRNDHGGLVIRQEGTEHEDDLIIWIPADRIPAFRKALARALKV